MGESRRVHFFLAALAIAGMAACSSGPRAKQASKSEAPLDKIQGKIQLLAQGAGSADARLNEGQPVLYLWQGVRRYTLFFRKPADIVPGKEYAVEGIDAQKAIDEIGDPDEGQDGYPLASSCERVVRMAWSGLSFDETDGRAAALRVRVKRYPARPVFLVMRIQSVAPAEPCFGGPSGGRRRKRREHSGSPGGSGQTTRFLDCRSDDPDRAALGARGWDGALPGGDRHRRQDFRVGHRHAAV
jgi:hypothetical protein